MQAFGRTIVYQKHASTHQSVNRGRVPSGGLLRGPKQEKFIDEQLMMSLRNVRQGRLYTLLTPSFTHFDLAHLAANMGILWSFGPRVIQHYGLAHFVIIWIGSSVC